MGRQTSRTRVWFGFLFLSTLRFTPRDQSSAHGLPRCTAAFLFPGKDWALTRDAAYDAASLRGWSAATVGVDLKPGGLRPSLPPFSSARSTQPGSHRNGTEERDPIEHHSRVVAAALPSKP